MIIESVVPITPEKAPKQKYKVPMSLCDVEKTQRDIFPKRLDEKKEKAPAIFSTSRKNAVFRNNSLKKRKNYISRFPRNDLELYINIVTLVKMANLAINLDFFNFISFNCSSNDKPLGIYLTEL